MRMRFQHSAIAVFVLAHIADAFQVSSSHSGHVKHSLANSRASSPTPTALYGKLWDKLQIEPDTMEDEPGWYVMNCVAGSEKDLLGQAKHVTRNIPPELIEKLSVPTDRHLRSHGKKQKVVEVRVMYPGYCFVKMRCCAETYEVLQELPLCRSWMAGTVNQKGYKKLPPAPICLSDEEVSKFKGLEEATSQMYEKFGEDYTGRGDSGEDLLAQYEGYEVDAMVKILSGNFKGEDGVVKRLKDRQLMVRLFTYGNINDQWFKLEELRAMTDAEAMKGLTGPAVPVGQDDFDISIGKKPREREDRRNTRELGGGRGERNRRQDRVNRGESGDKDLLGRTEQETAEEEQNWRQFREERRAEQQQKKGDQWGIKERTSWDAGDDAATFNSDGKWKSGREQRKERNKKEAETVADAVSGDGDWDLFSNDAQIGSSSGSGEEDDFFNSLMSELSDNLDTPDPPADSNSKGGSSNKQTEESGDDDFFASLMTELSDSMDSEEGERNNSSEKKEKKSSQTNEEDDFFASLEADLSESLQNESDGSSKTAVKSDEDDFFASLEADLSETLQENESSDSESNNDSFFNDLEKNVGEDLHVAEEDNDFFASLGENASSDAPKSRSRKSNESRNGQDLSSLKVPDLKKMLKERGLKVSGKKSELIERLQES